MLESTAAGHSHHTDGRQRRVNSVSVSFAGVDGANEVSAFECRLNDGTFEPCASPQEFTDLNNGVNTFKVRAIDAEGVVDPIPASEAWTIAVAALQTTISASPGDPTESRDATFVFSGAAGYQCALDGTDFTPCTSPQSYTGLSDDPHTLWYVVWMATTWARLPASPGRSTTQRQ